MARKTKYDDEWGETPKPKATKTKRRAKNSHELTMLAKAEAWEEFENEELYE